MEAIVVKPELKRYCCNLAEPTKVAVEGAQAWVMDFNRGNGCDRLQVLIRSRGGRWVLKWEKRERLTNFRVKTVVGEDATLYEKLLHAESPEDIDIEWLGRREA